MDDLISRQAAIDELHQSINIFEATDRIKDLPSVQPERKMGQWIDDNCSECGQYVYHGDARNFCPYCGADMRGEQND